MFRDLHIQRLLSTSIVLIFILSFSVGCCNNASAELTRSFEFQLDEGYYFTMILETKYEKEDAYNLRTEIDYLVDIENPDTILTDEEIDAYKEMISDDLLHEIEYVTIDNTSSRFESSTVEFENLGDTSESQETLYRYVTIKVKWPYVDVNATDHKFLKGNTDDSTRIKFILNGSWQITKYTGINNSKLSDDKKSVEGEEFKGYLVIVDFQKVTPQKDDDDDGWFLPGFEGMGLIITIVLISMMLYYRKSK